MQLKLDEQKPANKSERRQKLKGERHKIMEKYMSEANLSPITVKSPTQDNLEQEEVEEAN